MRCLPGPLQCQLLHRAYHSAQGRTSDGVECCGGTAKRHQRHPRVSFLEPLAVGAALGLLIAVATGRPALAADLENGEAIFNGNCTACHAGGNNSIVAEKKLKKEM